MDDLSPGKGSRHTATLGDPATGEETSGYGGMENDPPWSRSWHRNLLITPLSETAKNRDGYASIAAGSAPRPKNPSPDRQWAHKPRGKGDLVFRNLTRLGAALILVLAAALIVESVIASLPAIRGLGWSFFHQEEWDPVLDVFGAPAFVYGTLVSAFIAFVLATPFGFGISLYLTEIAPRSLRAPVSFMVELLAGIPSVVYGLWGIFVLAPFMRSHVDPFLMKWIGAPFFAPPSTGLSLLSAGLILSIMILPTLMAITLLLNIAARVLVVRTSTRLAGKKR